MKIVSEEEDSLVKQMLDVDPVGLLLFYFLVPGKSSVVEGNRHYAVPSPGSSGRTEGFLLLVFFHENSSGLKKSAFYHLPSLGEDADQAILSYNVFSLASKEERYRSLVGSIVELEDHAQPPRRRPF